MNNLKNDFERLSVNKNKIEEYFSVQVEKGATKKLIKDIKVVDGTWKLKNIKKVFGGNNKLLLILIKR